MTDSTTRRRFTQLVGAGVAVGLAGCGDGGPGDPVDDGEEEDAEEEGGVNHPADPDEENRTGEDTADTIEDEVGDDDDDNGDTDEDADETS
ncbi:hypothetical protein [Natronoglomus mannanivorans]|uniref:TAT (Twin-arginine translocation) pathway signal sequence n=1 Tax=Natronoglomus mannanivorans TaxID=2979990 RepID=A0AAP3E026_9EURY|nr:hypothetical protein [Halobacteria archaeon AArc-xg1-1]